MTQTCLLRGTRANDCAGLRTRLLTWLMLALATGTFGCRACPERDPALGQPAASTSVAWQESRAALTSGDWKVAIELLGAVIEGSPRFVKGHLLYQDVMAAEGHQAELQSVYEKRASRSGLDRALWARIAPHGKRTEYLQLAETQEPDNPWIQYALGFERLNRSDMEPARRHLERATWLDPDLPESRLALAVLYEKLVKNESAAEQYEAYLDRCPLDGLRWLKLAMVRQTNKDEDGAIEAYRKVVGIDGRDIEAAIRRRDVILTGEQLRRYQERYPLRYTARVNLSEIFVNRKQYAQARSLLEAALSENPDLPDAHFNLGIVHERLSLGSGTQNKKNNRSLPNSHAEQADHHWSRYLELGGHQQERVRGWLEALRARNPDPFGPQPKSTSRADS